ncbi:hypothetical protein [Francisella salimarina]|uniref:Uncharacterized protein n=1 Tax=Francisella salimarina TaxID=2599927 RepID=A0AAJ4NNQ4_9GAMM|nr:hypothetical protein [Francisella salimarina]QWU99367.1 hypothetical protein KQR59_00340 [Francisella salimarina]
MLTKILKNLYIYLICILSVSLGISSQIENTSSQNYFNNAVSLAKELKDKNICGTDKKYSLEGFYKGLRDRINNQDSISLKDYDTEKVSFSMGYRTGESSLKKGFLFTPKPKSDLYNPQAVIAGISDHYNSAKPKFKLIENTKLREILKSNTQALPKDISKDQFSYSLGFNLFKIPKNHNPSTLDEKSFISGMKAGLNNKKYTLSKQQVAEFSYIMGAFYSTNLENQQDKDSFLKGFESQLPKNIQNQHAKSTNTEIQN